MPRSTSLAQRRGRRRGRVQTTSVGTSAATRSGRSAQPLDYRGARGLGRRSTRATSATWPRRVTLIRARVLVGERRRAARRADRRLPRGRRRWRGGSGGSRRRRGGGGRAASMDPLPVDSDDELGELTRAFNEMQVQLRRVDVARKEFIATASHELRTPIFSLGGFVELLAGRGARRETRARVPRDDERAGGAAAEAVGRPARPVAPRRRLAGARARATWTSRSCARSVLGEFRPAVSAARHRARRRAAGDGVDGALRPRTGGSDHAYPARQRPQAHARGHPRHRERRPPQRGRRAHGGRHRAGRRSAAPRRASSSASGPATPPAAPGSASRSRRSWPSACTGGSGSRRAPGSTAFTLELRRLRRRGTWLDGAPARSGRGRWRPRRRRPAASGATTRLGGRRARSRPREVEASSRTSARRAASTRARSTTGSRPGVVTIISLFGRRARCSGTTAARAARAPASCSTATATSPPTRTS